jgi:hypothetical protein
MTSHLSLAPRRDAVRSDLLESRLRRYHPSFQGKVRALAKRHPRLADLAASFPALLFVFAVPRRGLDPARAIACVIDGLSLAVAAAAVDLPLWLRKLPPEAFAHPIERLPDGELFRRQIANHRPRSPKLAATWLQVVADVAEIAHEEAAVWIAREFSRDEPRRVNTARLRLISLWAWFSCQPGTFAHDLIDRPWTPDMRKGAADAAAHDWRTMIDLHLYLGREPISDMWLAPARVGGYDFLPLNSIASIAQEAVAMRNCLRTYGSNLAHNGSRLWSVRRDGERVATLRVAARYQDPLLNILELKGAGNTEAPRELWWTARRWLHMHDLSQIDVRQHYRRNVPMDRATWLSLWRPYWLAKRRIPEWLPIAPSRNVLGKL